MNTPNLTLHNAIFSSDDPRTVIGYDANQTYHLYDLQLDVKTLSIILSMDNSIKHVAIGVEDNFLFTVALCACLYAKKVPVFVNVNSSNETLASVCDVIITDSDLTNESIPVLDIREILVSNPIKDISEIPEINNDAKATPELDSHQKIVFYTSGSTGKSKRIEKTLYAMEQEANILFEKTQYLDEIENKVLLSTIPPYHMYGLTFKVFLPLLRRIPFASKITHFTEELLSVDKNIVLVSSPAFLKHIDFTLKAPAIVGAFSAGSPLPTSCASKFFKWAQCPVTEIYGSTETNIIAYRENCGMDELFTPFSNVTLRTDGKDVVLISPMIEKKFKLDDTLEFDGNNFKILGRTDRVVKIEEKRVSLSAIEDQVKKLDGIKDVAAITLDKGYRTFVALVISLNNVDVASFSSHDKLELKNQIRSCLGTNVPSVAYPRYIRVVENIPVNSMGKKIQASLRELFND